MNTTALDDLRLMSLEQLERCYAAAHKNVLISLPTGCFEGFLLARLTNRGARRLSVRASEAFAFKLFSFGIDFDAGSWFFGPTRLRIGRFVADIGPSHWRDVSTVVRLRYTPSRLPFRHLLYDEVTPLGPSLCLGLGGLDAERGEGDHFFFALSRSLAGDQHQA
ncbi:MAG: hypothetical protein KC503_24030 [Myxococcales bacterium]|nr:hypothetical protein [Myxococcales bacterium]